MFHKLRNIRQENKISQKEMASIIGISLSSYSDKELGHEDFRYGEMLKLANHFEVTLNDLFWESDKELEAENYV